jgi:hypothetical protein
MVDKSIDLLIKVLAHCYSCRFQTQLFRELALKIIVKSLKVEVSDLKSILTIYYILNLAKNLWEK